MAERSAVLISSGPPGAVGGVERFCALVQALLEREGWSVEVVWPDLEVPRLAFQFGGSALWWAKGSRAALGDRRPDLLLTNGPLGALCPPDLTRVEVFHGTSAGQAIHGDVGLPRRERFRRIVGTGGVEAKAARGATVVAVAERAAREVKSYYRAPVDRVIENGVDIELFSPGDRDAARADLGLAADGRYALFVGRLESRKGSDLLVDACAQSGFELVVAGPNAPDSARALGSLDAQGTAKAYTAADCVLFPTRYEGCSFVVLESLSAGVPLVTTRAGWMETFLRNVPEYRSLIVWPDAGDIAARLRTLDELDLPELTTSAREWVTEHNSLAAFERSWVALTDELVPAR